jgi:nicotinate phosphoribosyltransferase
MKTMNTDRTLLTDLYQLTMGAAYFYNGRDEVATFELFIRSLPEDWGYYIANGIEDAIDYITGVQFSDDDLDYLKSQHFKADYLRFLKDFRFNGDVLALGEGTPVFPAEPLLRVTAHRTQAQLVETALLNIVSFQTMVASKASRVVNAAHPAGVIEFGLRRAHEQDAGLRASRAAYLAGAIATSNVKAGKLYNIPVAGTHAHSFIMSFPDELEAFRAYLRVFPDQATLLIDTYDTIQGARHAITVARELEQQGSRLRAVRLDSGDLAVLSKEVRALFDGQGLAYIKIIASNDLNEYLIQELRCQDSPIDLYGVGTEMVTAKPVAAIPGVYKLAEDTAGPRIKLSIGKQTLPGTKQVYRQSGPDGTYEHDVLALDHEDLAGERLLEPAVRQGKRVRARPDPASIRIRCLQAVGRLPRGLKKVVAEGRYEVRLSPGLDQLTQGLLRQQHQ